MDTPTSSVAARAPEAPLYPLRGLVRFLYTHNPFYVVSAWLVFTGLRISFNTQHRTFDTWGLMLGLGGYTLLLAMRRWEFAAFGQLRR